MSSERDDAHTPTEGAPLTYSQVMDFLSPFSGPTLGPRELQDQLLQSSGFLPGIDSAHLLLLNAKQDSARFVWFGLDGQLSEGDSLDLQSLSWKSAFDHGDIWLEDDAKQGIELQDLPPLEEPFADRCLLPLKSGEGWIHSLLILQSNQASLFASWDRDLLKLMAHQLGHLIYLNDQRRGLESKLAKHEQQSSLYPPSLEGILQTSRSVLAKANPIATYLQHNVDILQGYLRKLHGAIDYYYDEIKLNAPEESQARVQKFAEYQGLDEIRADLDSLVEDSTEGIFQLRYFLSDIRDLHYPSTISEQLSFDDILDPIFPLVFSDRVVHINRPPMDSFPLYGNRTRLQQALLMLFFNIAKYIDLEAAPPQIDLRLEELEGWLAFRVQYALSSQVPSDEAEEFLFIRRVMEEHQGLLTSTVDGPFHELILHFPVMFTEEDSSQEERFSMEALELPALDSVEEMPAETSTPLPTRPKLLFLGTEQRFLRALRRILSPSFEIYLANSCQSALDVVQAHNDLCLLMCDLQEGADETLAFLEEIEARAPQLVPHMCFMISEKMSPQAQRIAHQVSMRTLNRHAPQQEFEVFIHRRVRL